MNLLLSFLVYNPLEALVIILGCDTITNRKFNIRKDIKYVYLLSTINLIIQIGLNMLPQNIIGLILNIIASFILASLVIKKVYYHLSMINYLQCFIIQSLYISSMMLMICIFNCLCNHIYIASYNSTVYEFIVNSFKTITQLCIIMCIRRIKTC